MELKGKALKDFWTWYLLPEQQKEYKTKTLINFSSENGAKIRFLAMSFTERYGVFVDFFDSVGIHITLNQLNYQTWYSYRITKLVDEFKNVQLNKRQEARIEAIKKANEIYNNRK